MMTARLQASSLPAAEEAPPSEDERLMARVAQGDREAFLQLVRSTQRLVAAIVGRLVWSEADRQELAQEVYLKVYEHARTYRSEAKLSTWIGCIASHTAINHLRKRRPVLFSDLGPEPRNLENVAGSGPGPVEEAERRDLGERLCAEIERLEPHYRVILALFHSQGMSYEEIGRTLDLPAGTVKSHLFRARAKLRERLSPAAAMEAI